MSGGPGTWDGQRLNRCESWDRKASMSQCVPILDDPTGTGSFYQMSRHVESQPVDIFSFVKI